MINLAIQWAAIVGFVILGTFLIRAYVAWENARANIRARLAEIRNRRYDFRIYETSWKREF